MAGSDKIKVPIIGETNKATLMVAVLAGVGALGYTYYKKQKTASATNAAATAAAGTAGVSPAGYAYGYGTVYNNSGFSYGYGYAAVANELYGQEAYAYGYTMGADSTNPSNTTGAITTNAQWSQEALTTLTSQGYTGTQVLAALGLYLTGGALPSSDVSIVQAAIAAEGYPPVAGAGGYPPAMNTAGTTTSSTGTTPANTVTVANVVGMPDGEAYNIIHAQGLKYADTGAKPNDVITGQSPKAGTAVAPGSTVTTTHGGAWKGNYSPSTTA